MTSSIDLSALTNAGLLRLHAQLSAELRTRAVCRSANNPVADYAEGLVAKALHLKLAGGSTTGFDAKDRQGRRYEIKARRTGGATTPTMLSTIRGLERKHFDFLVAVVFDEDYAVREAIQIPHGDVCKIARFIKHVNGHRVMIRDMAKVKGAKDVTKKVRSAVE